MINGLDTLWCFRQLLRPTIAGWYAPRLWSHKLARVVAYGLTPFAAAGLVVLAANSWLARIALGGGLAAALLAAVAVALPPAKRAPAIVSICGYAVTGAIAALEAWWCFLRGKHAATWEPTNRSFELAADA
jgi:hypothetical protein